MTTKREQPVDPYILLVDRYRKRGWTLSCDCPCHFWRNATREAAACCRMQGMRYIPGENAYVPWNDEQETQP